MQTPSIPEQIAAARTGALVVPRTSLTVLQVTGSDRQSWLNGLVTCELAKQIAGDAVYGLAVEKKGKVMADLLIVLGAEHALVAVDRGAVAAVVDTFEHHLVMEDAELRHDPDAFVAFEVHGPHSKAVLEAARGADGIGGLLDRTGLGGAVVIAKAASRDAVTAAMVSAGGTLGDEAAWEVLRIERSVPRFGADFDATTYPQEAHLEKSAISFSKGCYLGQEVVCMLELRGHVKRKLATLHVEGALPAPAHGAEVLDQDGKSIGAITSAAFSPTTNSVRALGMLKVAHCVVGTKLSLGASAGTSVTVVEPAV